jgi:hypothetical protein
MANNNAQKFIHFCEACGKIEILTPDEGFIKGWDMPPRVGSFGVISPRKCKDCSIKDTVWWAIIVEGKGPEDLSDKQKDTIRRIQCEPEILYASNGNKQT